MREPVIRAIGRLTRQGSAACTQIADTLTSIADLHAHKGWTEAELRRVLPATSEKVQAILSYIATHPKCTTADMAADLGLKSERSVGPTLNSLTKTAREFGVNDNGTVRWPFEYRGKKDGYEMYDMPAWIRAVVLEVLGRA